MQRKSGNCEKLPNRNNYVNLDSSGNERLANNPTVHISRAAYSLRSFQNTFEVIETKKTNLCESIATLVKPSCGLQHWKDKLNNVLPITHWLLNYNFKQDFLADIIVGITVAIFQVPQSMGYSLIAHVPPVHGLYTAFFPALIYSFLGTSRHSAVGAFAIVSGVMTGNLVTEVMQQNGVSLKEIEESMSFGTVTSTSFPETDAHDSLASNTPIQTYEIATAASLWIGIYMLLFGVLRLGFITFYLSEQLISGFATSASFYVFTSQLRYLFGVHLPYNSGLFAIVQSYIDLVHDYRSINPVTTTVSVICCVVLLFFKGFVNERMKNAGFKIPIPVELFVVIGGTIASYAFDLRGNYDVQIVGEIKKGLPLPELPRLDVMRQTWFQSVSLATVGFTITLTVGKLYGNKHGYEVRHNQELMALGTTNVFSSFFGCLPSAASLPRSAVQEQAGGRTQMASFVNCGMILVVLFYLAPLLEKLPNCVLASIIAVALKSLLAEAKEFNRYLKISKLDASIWAVSFLSVLILDVDLGLYTSVAYSLLVLIYKTSRPKSCILGSINKSDLYVPLLKYVSADEIPGIKVYRFCGPLHFANVEYFKSDILEKTELNQRYEYLGHSDTKYFVTRNAAVDEILAQASHRTRYLSFDNSALTRGEENDSESSCGSFRNVYNHLIVDCSMISYCDAAGIQMLRKVIGNYQRHDINVHLAACTSNVIGKLEKSDFFSQFSKDSVYISIHDAVLYIVYDEQKQCENCFDCKECGAQKCNDKSQRSESSCNVSISK